MSLACVTLLRGLAPCCANITMLVYLSVCLKTKLNLTGHQPIVINTEFVPLTSGIDLTTARVLDSQGEDAP